MTTKLRRGATATVVAGVIGFGALAMVSPASAGEQWPGEVEAGAACFEGDGVVLVDIFDDFSATYDVFLLLGDELIDAVEGITDTDEGEETVVFAGLDDGTYTVIVDWLFGEEDFLNVFDGDVTVDCVPDDTTTTSSVSPASTTPAPAPPADAAAAAATPRFTG